MCDTHPVTPLLVKCARQGLPCHLSQPSSRGGGAQGGERHSLVGSRAEFSPLWTGR